MSTWLCKRTSSAVRVALVIAEHPSRFNTSNSLNRADRNNRATRISSTREYNRDKSNVRHSDASAATDCHECDTADTWAKSINDKNEKELMNTSAGNATHIHIITLYIRYITSKYYGRHS
jgi:hypothetical protein